MPSHGESRQKWIDAIKGHQIADFRGVIRYKICQLHFHQCDMKFLKSTTELKKEAVPSIFPNSTAITRNDVECEEAFHVNGEDSHEHLSGIEYSTVQYMNGYAIKIEHSILTGVVL